MPKLSSSNSSSIKITPHPQSLYRFALDYEVRESSEGGSSATYDLFDTEVTKVTTAMVTTEANVLVVDPAIQAFDAEFSYTSLTPGIGTVDSTGRVTRVADGDVLIKAASPFYKQTISVPVLYESPTSATSYGDRVDGSLAKHCNDAVDDLIDGRTFATNGPMFTDLSAGTRNANSALTLAGIDNTGIDIEKPNAFLLAVKINGFLSRKYGTQAEHYPDSLERYANEGSTVYERAVTNSRNIGPSNASDGYVSDIRVVQYASELDASITPIKLLPSDVENYLPSLSSINEVAALASDQEKKTLVANLAGISSTRVTYRVPEESPNSLWGEQIVSGDSGSPAFLLINDELVAVTLWTYGGGGSGPVLHNFITEIEAAIAEMEGGSPTVEVQTVVLGGFVDYTNHNILSDSEDFTTSSWIWPSGRTQDGTYTAPDGTAVPVYEFDNHSIRQDLSVENGETYTTSVWIKASAEATIGFRPPSGVGSAGNVDKAISTEWTQISVSATKDAGLTQPGFILDSRSSSGYSVPSDLKLAVWHPQTNKGSSPMGYQGT